MKEEKLLRAIGNVNDDLIADAMTPPAQKTANRGWLRWIAAVACLCLLLASPIGAAMQGTLGKSPDQNGSLEYFTKDRLLLEELTAEALAAFPNVAQQANYLGMPSVADAEEYLGLDLPDNLVLEDAVWDEIHLITEYGEKIDAHCIVRLLTGDAPEPYCVDVEAAYRMKGALVEVMYRCPTEKNPYDNGGGVGIEQWRFETEQYTSVGGRTWDIYVKTSDDAAIFAHALANVNGALTWVQIWHISEHLTGESLKELLIEIVDAYE